MKTPTALATAPVLAIVLTLASGCGRQHAAPPSSASAASPAAATAASGKPDYSSPALTEEKLNRFISSLAEDKNPMEFIFKPGGQMRSLADMAAKEAEFNAFARRYGFQDYKDYMDVWGRVTIGQVQIGTAQMLKSVREMSEKSLEDAETALRKPNLSADERSMYTEQVTQAKKSLADLEKSGAEGLNAADLALVEKYNERIDEAVKSHKRG